MAGGRGAADWGGAAVAQDGAGQEVSGFVVFVCCLSCVVDAETHVFPHF